MGTLLDVQKGQVAVACALGDLGGGEHLLLVVANLLRRLSAHVGGVAGAVMAGDGQVLQLSWCPLNEGDGMGHVAHLLCDGPLLDIPTFCNVFSVAVPANRCVRNLRVSSASSGSSPAVVESALINDLTSMVSVSFRQYQAGFGFFAI